MFYGVWRMRAHEYGVTPLVYMLMVASCTTSTNDFTLFLYFMSTHKLYRFFFQMYTLCAKYISSLVSLSLSLSLLLSVSCCIIFTRTRDIIWIAYYIHIYYPFGVQLACVYCAVELNDLVTIWKHTERKNVYISTTTTTKPTLEKITTATTTTTATARATAAKDTQTHTQK